MCNPLIIKSMGFWDYLSSDQPCSTATWNYQSDEMIRTATLIGIILILLGIFGSSRKYARNKMNYTLPDRTKCINCNHVFTEHEIRWASPFMETLCDKCHSDWLGGKIKL